MTNIEIDWLVYVDTPDWTRDGDWRQHISTRLRAAWPTLTYEQKWTIAQSAAGVPRNAPPSVVSRVRADLDRQGGVTPVDRPDGIASAVGGIAGISRTGEVRQACDESMGNQLLPR